MGPEALAATGVRPDLQTQEEVMAIPAMLFNNAQQHDNAVEAVTTSYAEQVSFRERISDFGHNVVETAARSKRSIVAVGVGIVAAFSAAAPAEATTVTPKQTETTVNGVTYTETSSSAVLVGKSSSSASAFAKLNIVGNYRTVSAAKVRQAKRRGQCDTMSGAKAMKLGLRTQGHNGSGKGYALENRKSTFCDVNNDGKYDFRAECGNRAKGGRPNIPQAKQTLWVNNFNKTNVSVKTKLKVEAQTGCELKVAGGSVYATARGSAESSASVSVKLRNAVKAGGSGVTKLENVNLSKLSISLRNDAKADASVECKGKGGTVVTEKPPTDNPEYQCPPEAPGTYPNCVPPTSTNRPPTGRMARPDHVYTGGSKEVCVDDISDPDGDAVTVSNFMFRNPAGNPTGSWDSSRVYTNPDGDQCVMYTAGNTEQQVTVSADLQDGRGGKTTVSDNFPVLRDDFGA